MDRYQLELGINDQKHAWNNRDLNRCLKKGDKIVSPPTTTITRRKHERTPPPPADGLKSL